MAQAGPAQCDSDAGLVQHGQPGRHSYRRKEGRANGAQDAAFARAAAAGGSGA